MIPAGGVGTRLWPLSRAAAPKFLHDLTGSGSTLLRATYDRLEPLAGNRVLVVTGTAHRAAVCRQLPEVQDSDLVLESEPKDSGAAIGLAAAILHERDPDTIMGSFAADQVISPDDLFQDAVREAIHTAAAGKIVTIGIKPTHPSTGFGYIRAGAGTAHRRRAQRPGRGGVRGEAGRGSCPAVRGQRRVCLERRHVRGSGCPDAQAPGSQPAGAVQRACRRSPRPGTLPKRDAVTARVWPTLPKIAIDYAVAEPAAAAGDVAVVPGTFGWDDVGDFASVGRLNSAREVDDVTVIGEGARVFTENASGVVVSDTKRVIALIGIKDVVIVDTGDALLVTTKQHAQRVKGPLTRSRPVATPTSCSAGPGMPGA